MAGSLCNREDCSLLLFFILLVLIFCNCPQFQDLGCELLLFFLLLVILFCSCN